MNATNPSIAQVVSTPAIPPPSPGVQVLTQRLKERYGDALEAVLFYGSCLRSGDDQGQIVDLYVLVDSYRSAHARRLHALLNRILPPSVYYLEAPAPDHTARAKYAVISMRDFERGTSGLWFHSYLWGRFSQPTAIVHARSDAVRDRVQRALANAAITLIRTAVPCLPRSFNARGLWETALGLSYSAELRTEPPDRVRELVESAPEYYRRLAAAILPRLPFTISIDSQDGSPLFQADIPVSRRRRTRLAWRARRFQGKALSVLRLIKGLLTFNGGVDYIAWKIERHSGIAIEITPRLRRYPLLGGWVVLWRLYRSGRIR